MTYSLKITNNITSRAVLYVGYKCNAHCQFCYYHFKKNKNWVNLEKLKAQAQQFRYFYKNNLVDITGGEPTIYPHIFELVKYCNLIDLKPTIITNALALADKQICLKFKQSGIHDFLISIFGIDEIADEITGVPNTYQKQLRALDNLIELNIPFRINITAHQLNQSQLIDIAKLAIKNKAKVVNILNFNPFLDWQNKTNIQFQAKYSSLAPDIIKAVNLLAKNNILVNLRYFPFCQFKNYEKNICGFMQVSYDPYEWNFNSWGNYFLFNPSQKWYAKEAVRKRIYDAGYVKSAKCNQCSLNYICDGFPAQYVKRFGWDEAKPYNLNKKIKNPTYFMLPRPNFSPTLSKQKIWPYLMNIIKNRLKYIRLKLTQPKIYEQ